MNDLAKFNELIQVNDISMKSEQVASNPILAEDTRSEALRHFRCQLLSSGKRLDVYLTIHAEDQPLTLFDVLFLLALDASGCGMMAGYEVYREKWNGLFGAMGNKPKEIEFFWEELAGRCRQTEALQAFLGDTVYQELLTLFGLEQRSSHAS